MAKVIIGVDPHKLSATIEVVDQHERLLGSGRFTTDQAGCAAMRSYVKAWPDRVWAVEGSNGAGRPLAQRLLETGEHVVDVPAKLAARVRVLFADGELAALRMLCDRRDELARLRVQIINRLRRLPSELIPGQGKKDLSALQAKAILATVRPRDIAGKTRRRIAAEELADLVAVEAKIKKATAELKTMVGVRGSRLMEIRPGRALRGGSSIQRGRPAPAHRHFGSATSRTRSTDATPSTARCEPTRGPGSQPSALAHPQRQRDRALDNRGEPV